MTNQEIHTLRAEAADRGDTRLEALCLLALGADPSEADPGTDLADLGDEGLSAQDAYDQIVNTHPAG